MVISMKSKDFFMGSPINKPGIVIQMILIGRPMFWNGRFYSNSFMRGQRIQTIVQHAKEGAFCFAHERAPK